MPEKPRLGPELLGVAKGEATAAPQQPEDVPLPPGYVALTLRVSPEMHEKLRERAFRRRTKVAVLVREALERYLSE